MNKLLILATLLGALALAGCEQGPAEDAGEAVDNAVENAGDAVENAADAVEDAADNATN